MVNATPSTTSTPSTPTATIELSQGEDSLAGIYSGAHVLLFHGFLYYYNNCEHDNYSIITDRSHTRGMQIMLLFPINYAFPPIML